MANVACSSRSLLSLLALVATVAAKSPLAGQRILFRSAEPCVRLLNNTGSVGCATPMRGVIERLHVLRDGIALAALLRAPPDDTFTVAIPAELFEPATFASLTSSLGATLRGILVLHAASMPTGASSPAPTSSWNPAGSGWGKA